MLKKRFEKKKKVFSRGTFHSKLGGNGWYNLNRARDKEDRPYLEAKSLKSNFVHQSRLE